MTHSKEELHKSVLFFAEKFNKLKSYQFFISSDVTMPEIVRYISYEMFLNKFSISDGIGIDEYNIIHKYALELSKIGYANYN